MHNILHIENRIQPGIDLQQKPVKDTMPAIPEQEEDEEAEEEVEEQVDEEDEDNYESDEDEIQREEIPKVDLLLGDVDQKQEEEGKAASAVEEFFLLLFFFVFTHSQETQKTRDIVVMLVSQIKEIIKIHLLRVHQHDRHDIR